MSDTETIEASHERMKDQARQIAEITGIISPTAGCGLEFDMLRERIVQKRKESGKPHEKNRLISTTILGGLSDKGRFYRADNDLFYFLNSEKKLFSLESDEFSFFLSSRFGLNQTENEFRFSLNEIQTRAYIHGIKTEVYSLAYFDKTKRVLYISNGKNQIYRLDGREIRLVDNGTEGILFNSDFIEPFESVESSAVLLEEILFSGVKFSSNGLSVEECQKLIMAWIYAIFFESLFPTKPIPAFVGPKGSGKTSIVKKIGLLIFGQYFNVISPKKEKEDGFIATISNQPFVGLDNVDSYIVWLADALALASTGQKIQMRKLYTTNTLATYYPKCFIAISSRTPPFKRDDVVDRLLVFKTERLERFIPEGQIKEQIRNNRNILWTELLKDLNDIVSRIGELKTSSCDFRLADFGNFFVFISGLGGAEQEGRTILQKMAQEQNEFLVDDDPAFETLGDWLEKPTNLDRSISTGELFSELQSLAGQGGIKFPIETSRGFGMWLKNVESNIERGFNVKVVQRVGHARKKYISFKKGGETGESKSG